jgi:hypothetical protein
MRRQSEEKAAEMLRCHCPRSAKHLGLIAGGPCEASTGNPSSAGTNFSVSRLLGSTGFATCSSDFPRPHCADATLRRSSRSGRFASSL